MVRALGSALEWQTEAEAEAEEAEEARCPSVVVWYHVRARHSFLVCRGKRRGKDGLVGRAEQSRAEQGSSHVHTTPYHTTLPFLDTG